MYMKMQLGPVHLGTQATFKNLATTAASAVMNQRAIVGGAALVFGDTLSLSYGVGYDKYRYNDRNRHTVSRVGHNSGTNLTRSQTAVPTGQGHYDMVLGPEDHEYVTQRYHGWSAALNMGPVALKGTSNHVNSGEVTGIYENGDRHNEINLSIAF
jgi:hypothetical protein